MTAHGQKKASEITPTGSSLGFRWQDATQNQGTVIAVNEAVTAEPLVGVRVRTQELDVPAELPKAVVVEE